MATDLDSTLAASARAYLAHREAQIQTLQKGRIQARLDLFVETTGIYGFIEYVLTQERLKDRRHEPWAGDMVADLEPTAGEAGG